MFCTKCGSQVKDGAAFCPKCGTPMAQQEPQPHQQEPYQPADARQAPDQQQVPGQPQPKARRRWPIVVAACVVAAAAVAAVVVFVVLPSLAPKGVWIATKSTLTSDSPSDHSTYAWTCTLDDKGNCTHKSSESSYSNGDTTSKSEYDYEYDENGFCKSEADRDVHEFNTTNDTSDISSTCTYQWTFGNNGMPTKVLCSKKTDEASNTSTYEYEYNSNGNISKRITKYDGGSFAYESYAEFDDKGLVTTSGFSDEDISTQTTHEYELDSTGKPNKCTYTTKNTVTGKTVREGTYTYERDENGNVTTFKEETTSYPDDGSKPEKSTSVETLEYTFVQNPSPWISQTVRLYAVPTSTPV